MSAGAGAVRSIGSIGSNALATLLANAGVRGLGLLLVLAIARVYSLEDAGRWAIAATFALVVSPFLELGMDAQLTRAVSRAPETESAALGASLVVRLVATLIATPVALVIAERSGYGSQVSWLLICGMGSMCAVCLCGSYASVLRARQRFDHEGAFLLATRVLMLAFPLTAVLRREPIELVGGSLLAGGGAGFVLAVILGRLLGLRPGFDSLWRRAVELVTGSLPFAATALMVMIYFRIDMLMLGAMQGESATAHYNANTQLLFGALMLSQALVAAVFPVIARSGRLDAPELAPRLRRAFNLSLVTTLPFAVGLPFVGVPLLRSLFGERYADGATSLSLLLATLPVLGLTNLAGHLLGAIGRQRLVLMVAIVNAALNVGLNLWLIPRFSYAGASLATLVTEVVGLLMLSRALASHGVHIGKQLDGRSLGLMVAVTALAAVLARSLPLVLAVAIPGTACVWVLFATGLVRSSDLPFARRGRGTAAVRE